MIHAIFLLVGVFMVLWGVVICAMLIYMSLKIGKAIWLVTAPGILIVAILAVDFSCHIFHIARPAFPYQHQVVKGIRWLLQLAAIPLLVAKLYEWWQKKRAQPARSRETSI